MHKVLILACCAVSISLATSSVIDITKKLKIPVNKNGTLLKTIIEKVASKTLNKLNDSTQLKKVSGTILVNKNETLPNFFEEKIYSDIQNKQDDAKQVQKTSSTIRTKSTASTRTSGHKHHSKNDAQKSFPMLQKIHQRITRSKDAIWATITLTALCILLVLAVAQSRMWKDHYYSESQGVPLPNFNERVLFKDVMERKISSLKQFFKKKKPLKEGNITELESLLPSSEWDS